MKPAVEDCLNISYVCNDVAFVCILVGLGKKLCKETDLVLAHIPCIRGYRYEHRRRQLLYGGFQREQNNTHRHTANRVIDR